MDFVFGILRSLIFFIDQVIYGFIPSVYNFIIILSQTTVFKTTDIDKIATNIYSIIGLFFVFRIAFILLQSIIDPEKLTDKQSGVGKMLSKIVIALVLIVAIPYGFDLAYKVQTSVIHDRILEKIIIGGGAINNINEGNNMSYMALKSFLKCNDNIKSSTDPQAQCPKLEEDLKLAFSGKNGTDFTELAKILNDKATDAKGNSIYAYDYNAPISTVCGVAMLFILLSMCFDISVRAIKLGFLQMISPVAVAGYVEPKSDIFNRWLKECFTTYANLFVRIIAISFVVFVLSKINANDIQIDSNTVTDTDRAFVQIFIIIGLLIFSKEAPKLIMEMLNIKESGLGSMNPWKKFKEIPYIGGAAAAGVGIGAATVTGVAGKAVGATFGGISGGLSSLSRQGSFRAGAMQGAAAGAKGVSLKGGFKGMGKQLKGSFSSWHAGGNAGATGALGKENKTGFQRFGEMVSSRYTQSADSAQENKRLENAKNLYNEIDALKTQKANNPSVNPFDTRFSKNYADAMNNLDNAKGALGRSSAAAKFAETRFEKDPTEENRTAYIDATKAQKGAESAIEVYKSLLDTYDGQDIYKKDAGLRQMYDSYSSQVKAQKVAQTSSDGPESNELPGQMSFFDNNNDK